MMLTIELLGLVALLLTTAVSAGPVPTETAGVAPAETGGAVPRCRSITPSEAPEHGVVLCFQRNQDTFCTIRCDPLHRINGTGEVQVCGPLTGYRWEFRDFRDHATCVPSSPNNAPEVHLIIQSFVDEYPMTGQPNCNYKAKYITNDGVTEFTGAATNCNNIQQINETQCQIPTAPQNGGMICYSKAGNNYCALRCNNWFDFGGKVNHLGICSPITHNKWTFLGTRALIGRCVPEFFPGVRLNSDEFYFPGKCEDLSSTQISQMKGEFRTVLRGVNVEANEQDMSVVCGSEPE